MIKKIIIWILVTILLIVVGGYAYYRLAIYQPPAISAEDRSEINLMPLPAKLKLHSGKFEIADDLHVSFKAFSNDRLKRAAERFMDRLSSTTSIKFKNEPTSGNTIVIDCLNDSSKPIQQVKEDESYSLKISGSAIVLKSNTPYGVLRGLETLLQLVKTDNSQAYFPTVEIEDAPRFAWRGIMIDVSRHWMPKEVIYRNLDAMAAVKLNVLHLHLTDDQGFRIESKVFPKLHELGSDGKYYTQEEMRNIIQYAADRGIRIVPEFDLPGHTKSWQVGYPELSSTAGPFMLKSTDGNLFSVPLDPTNESVYSFVDKFVGEMSDLFPDAYLHIGGDEVNPKSWNESKKIQAYRKAKDLRNAHDLQAYFNYRMNAILKTHGKAMIGWEEIIHPDLNKDVIIQSWKSQRTLFEGVQKGGNAILSAGYYLDHKLHAGKHYQVDPLILPGAVDIQPDTTHWKLFSTKMELPGNTTESQLVLFDKDPQNVFGYFMLLDQLTSFKKGTLINGDLKMKINTPVGELEYSAKIINDSINGNLAFGLLKFASYGHQTGGSDRSGLPLPKVEVMKPLTEDEKQRILGGEAAMWSEVVSPENIDSRLWPRSAAIAEKFWSPATVTTDEEDMYRRLGFISDHLTRQGAIHDAQYEVLIRRLIPNDGFPFLKTLIDALEEVKYYNRLSTLLNGKPQYLPDLPLDGVADAAKPESMIARSFNKMVDAYFADPKHEANKPAIVKQLSNWRSNHESLKPFFESAEKLKQVEKISKVFSSISAQALAVMNGEKIPETEKEKINANLSYLENGENGVLIAVTPGLRRILLPNN